MKLKFEQLDTLLKVEAVVNSRLQTYLSGDTGEAEVMTSSHFLSDRRLTAIPQATT